MMLKFTALAALCISVAGCGSVDTVSRNAPFEAKSLSGVRQAVARSYTVENMNLIASRDLRVSEGGSYYPLADIVWRGDPIGDRQQQVMSMFATAIERSSEVVSGDIPVTVQIELVRFHGVTERTRYFMGGVYNIKFDMTVFNAVTGQVIEATRRIEADLSAPGGVAAVLADQRGQTEKVRVTDFLTQVMRDELTGSYRL